MFFYLNSNESSSLNHAYFTIKLPRVYKFTSNAQVALVDFSMPSPNVQDEMKILMPFSTEDPIILETKIEPHLSKEDHINLLNNTITRIMVQYCRVKMKKFGWTIVPVNSNNFSLKERKLDVISPPRFMNFNNGTIQIAGEDERGSPIFVHVPLHIERILDYQGLVLDPRSMLQDLDIYGDQIVAFWNVDNTNSTRYTPALSAGQLVDDSSSTDGLVKLVPPKLTIFPIVRPINNRVFSNEYMITCSLVNSTSLNTRQVLDTITTSPEQTGTRLVTNVRYPLFHDLQHFSFNEITIKVKDYTGVTLMLPKGPVNLTLCIEDESK